ncbi:MAG: hypothetical protein MZU97_08450 [Bacillus subtilis]|nr:hypothetical protein [Bacillus subtilis]
MNVAYAAPHRDMSAWNEAMHLELDAHPPVHCFRSACISTAANGRPIRTIKAIADGRNGRTTDQPDRHVRSLRSPGLCPSRIRIQRRMEQIHRRGDL